MLSNIFIPPIVRVSPYKLDRFLSRQQYQLFPW